jgi:hypothetical protein
MALLRLPEQRMISLPASIESPDRLFDSAPSPILPLPNLETG